MVTFEIASSTSPVIMVDDSDDDILLARLCYDASSMKNPFVPLTSGQALLAYLDGVEAGENEMPALVLLDINMPGLDGFEVLSRVRNRPMFANEPIIMMLTHSDYPADEATSRDLGANGFKTKPFERTKYIAFFDSLAA
jgi:CheY-like chemotaxis protein